MSSRFSAAFLVLGLFLSSCGGGNNVSDSEEILPEDEDALTISCTELISGPARGLAMLHGMHPNAAAQLDVLGQVILRSCIQQIAINFLIDGSFDFQPGQVTKLVKRLQKGGRQVHFVGYLTNGASQRKYRTTPIDAFGVRVRPEDFRYRIIHDRGFQDQFKAVVSRATPMLQEIKAAGATIHLVVGLEDNLQLQHALKLRDLAAQVLPAELNVRFGRNPCKSCYPGNDDKTEPLFFRERHTTTDNFPTANGIISNDGDAISLADAVASRNRAAALNNYYIFWSATRQGCGVNGNKPLCGDDPDKRHYSIPSTQEQDELVKFLRGEI